MLTSCRGNVQMIECDDRKITLPQTRHTDVADLIVIGLGKPPLVPQVADEENRARDEPS